MTARFMLRLGPRDDAPYARLRIEGETAILSCPHRDGHGWTLPLDVVECYANHHVRCPHCRMPVTVPPPQPEGD